MKIAEVMTPNPVCCWPSSSALSAALLMLEKDTGILPVVEDPFTPRLAGVVTDRDLCLHVVAGGRDPAHIWISECMTTDAVYCRAEDQCSHALELMREHRVRRLPVVNDQLEVVGIVSVSDLVRMAALDSNAIITALHAISQPRVASRGAGRRIVTAA